MTASQQQLAKYLLEIEAVKFNVDNPFTWTSGIKSPIYCDNRIINSRVYVRDVVISEFSDLIIKIFPEVEIIAGVALGGISYGALVADRLKLPFIYVREERKEHGLMKLVEGEEEFRKGAKVILIEDHISTGKSSMNAIKGLREKGLEIIWLISIMTYRFKEAEELYKKENVAYTSLCNLDTILEVALQEGRITEQDRDIILKFRESPRTWSPNNLA
jgi:orotate phosphoribosyltransferase